MFVDLLSSRAIQFGLAFFLVVVCSSLLYSWHVQRTTEVELTRSNETLQPIEHPNGTPTVDISPVDFGEAGTPLEADTEQPPIEHPNGTPNEDVVPMDLSDAFLPDDFVSEMEPAQDVLLSPFGFGPYPEIPSDYPFTPIWAVSDTEHESSQANYGSTGIRNFELLSRVLIQLWDQGHRGLVGGSIDKNGNVMPAYRNVAYVTYNYTEKSDGSLEHYISNVSGAPGLNITPEMLQSGDIPGVTLIDKEDATINAYDFLSLDP